MDKQRSCGVIGFISSVKLEYEQDSVQCGDKAITQNGQVNEQIDQLNAQVGAASPTSSDKVDYRTFINPEIRERRSIMQDIKCRSLTLVDDKGNPKLFLFLDGETNDPAIVMSGDHGRLHMFLGNDGVRFVMADGPGNAKVIITADETCGRLDIVPAENIPNCEATRPLDLKDLEDILSDKVEELVNNHIEAMKGL